MTLEELAVAAALAMLAAAVAFLLAGSRKASRASQPAQAAAPEGARPSAGIPALAKAAAALEALAAALLAAGFGLRWRQYAAQMDIGLLASLPVSTLYESAVFAVFALLLLLMALRRRIGGGAFPAAILAAGAASILGLSFSPRVSSDALLFLPSLKSGWLAAHVSLTFVAYAMYALAAALGARFLWRRRRVAKRAEGEEGDKADGACSLGLLRLLILNGTLVFTVGGLVFGAVWAQKSWGRFWAWDPKETWAFITWCLYLALLHFDMRGKLSSRALAWGAIAAFAAVLFTYLGVNLLFTGLHSYAAA